MAIQGSRGLAMLRLKDLKEKTLGLRLKSKSAGVIDTFDAQVRPDIPDWWSAAWYANAQ